MGDFFFPVIEWEFDELRSMWVQRVYRNVARPENLYSVLYRRADAEPLTLKMKEPSHDGRRPG